MRSASAVAPFVGAWIETTWTSLVTIVLSVSRPSWARGLKQKYGYTFTDLKLVAPFVGAWIETQSTQVCRGRTGSRPSWARGLKLVEFMRTHACLRRALRGRVD